MGAIFVQTICCCGPVTEVTTEVTSFD